MTAPCSYRSLGWHELGAHLHLMIFRAGQKLSKRPLHYQHVLRDLLPQKEVNHAYTLIRRHGSWTAPLPWDIVPDRRLWATGELTPFPDGYFRRPLTKYCSPLLDDDTVRFSRPFRPIVSGTKRKVSSDTSMGRQAYTADGYTQRGISVRQWCLDCDHARDEWTMGPPADPENVEMVAYRQEQPGDVQLVVQKLWSGESYFSSIVCWKTILVGELRRPTATTGAHVVTSIHTRKRTDPAIAKSTNEPDIFPDLHSPMISVALELSATERVCNCTRGVYQMTRGVYQTSVHYHLTSDENIHGSNSMLVTDRKAFQAQPLGIGYSYGYLPAFNQQEAAVALWNTRTASMWDQTAVTVEQLLCIAVCQWNEPQHNPERQLTPTVTPIQTADPVFNTVTAIISASSRS
ncbi:predicted protein [Postia placenta Mad-698-R]|uniref:Uncharacterized protein n=1 Tax=Postia placenta MAD-698-R-SB12 TaxID=670580 RepID=A0A1X6N4Y2_9APHY|nr:hypothetical protein POSPLADRAFT_1139562 [Postia placenta MAD-698-R-SB12]EED79459.1 predicted protein [Postia placenta Mad-698-R]OSX63681.1 hypothetical protein POSPLADRAFT_1139562 [Postia placenta MAD-698-R-SB12]